MLSNKLLTLSLSALLLSTPAFARNMGAETGGGGDAVIVNGKPVIRDVLNQIELKSIDNNIEFLQSIEGFEELIKSIAKVNPAFATDIIRDLSSVAFYLSAKDLPLLPYGQTTMSGSVGAEIQLAVRTGGDVILAPQFFENEFTKYTMIHEALHGILPNSVGPAHHQRVRNIINYLYNNRLNLDAEELDKVLKKNNYFTKASVATYGNFQPQYVWDDKLDTSVRCFFTSTGNLDSSAHFQKLDCGDFLESADPYSVDRYKKITKYINSLFPSLESIRYGVNIDLYKLPIATSLEVKKLGYFDGQAKRRQESWCDYNKGNLVKIKEAKTEIERKLNLVNKFIEERKATLFSKEIQDALIRAAGESSTIGEDKKQELEKGINEINSTLKTAQENEVNCKKFYPN